MGGGSGGISSRACPARGRRRRPHRRELRSAHTLRPAPGERRGGSDLPEGRRLQPFVRLRRPRLGQRLGDRSIPASRCNSRSRSWKPRAAGWLPEGRVSGVASGVRGSRLLRPRRTKPRAMRFRSIGKGTGGRCRSAYPLHELAVHPPLHFRSLLVRIQYGGEAPGPVFVQDLQPRAWR